MVDSCQKSLRAAAGGAVVVVVVSIVPFLCSCRVFSCGVSCCVGMKIIFCFVNFCVCVCHINYLVSS